MGSRTTLSLSLLALLAAGCDLASVQVGDGFREGDDDPSSEDASEDGGDDGQDGDDQGDDGDVPPDDEPTDEPPADDEPTDEPPADDEPTDEPPPADDDPADEPLPGDVSLQTAFEQCAFNMVWTRGLHFNSGLPIGASLIDLQDADSLVFAPNSNNAWVFPGIAGGESVLTLELVGVDEATGEYLVRAVVENATQRLELPTLSLDVDQPIVLVDATVQSPEAVGPAILKSLVDGTESSYEIEWGLVVDLNGGDNGSPLGACEPILESVYGPLD